MKFSIKLRSNEKFLKNISTVMLANLVKIILGIVLIPIYVNYVSPQELGKFDLIMSFMPILNQFISMGLTNSVAKFYLESHNVAYLIYIRNKLFIHTMIAIGVLTVIYGIFYTYSSDFIEFYLFILFLILLLLENITFVQYRIYNFHENYKRNSIVAVSSDLLRYAVVIMLVVFLEDKLLALFLGSIASWLYLYIQTYKDNNSIFAKNVLLTSEQIVTLKNYSTPLIFLGLSGFLYLSLDRIMVSIFSDSIEEVGFLGIAQRLTTVINIVISSVATVLGVTMFKTSDMKKLLMIQNRYLYFLLGLTIVTLLIYIIFKIHIIHYILTDTYKKAFPIGILLLISLYWNMSRENLEIFFLMQNKTKLVTKIFIIFTIVNILLNIYFIPRYNAIGAVIATNIAFFLHTVVMIVQVKKNAHDITIKPFLIFLAVNLCTYYYLFNYEEM